MFNFWAFVCRVVAWILAKYSRRETHSTAYKIKGVKSKNLNGGLWWLSWLKKPGDTKAQISGLQTPGLTRGSPPFI
jgi:hypothetical protein